MATKKRTLDSFFTPSSKKARTNGDGKPPPSDEVAFKDKQSQEPPSTHATYPFAVPQLPLELSARLADFPSHPGKIINNQPDLNLLYYEPYVPRGLDRRLFEFLRRELFFYRVEYKIKRGGIETQIHTPRYTTVFGVDETSKFSPTGEVVDSTIYKPVPKDRYKTCPPRPIPACLDELRRSVERNTGHTFNFCLVNYYATGADSISYHSDDERFLGPEPAIASFSLGARRDFLMKYKSPTPQARVPAPPATSKIKLPLASGDMVLMRGKTQSQWLHSIPKRKEGGGGRINITFRRAMARGGTDNYYTYNVGNGRVFHWDESTGEMKLFDEKS